MKAGASGFNPYPSTTQQYPQGFFHIRATPFHFLRSFPDPFRARGRSFRWRALHRQHAQLCGAGKRYFTAGVAR